MRKHAYTKTTVIIELNKKEGTEEENSKSKKGGM